MKAEVDDSLFSYPDPFMKNKEISLSLQRKILAQILPHRFLVMSLGISALLFAIPVILIASLVLLHEEFISPAVLISSSLFYCFYSLLLGFFLLHTRLPYMAAWKEKLGYKEV